MTPIVMKTLINRLPSVRGELRALAPLAKSTWFQVGGAAEVLFRPKDIEDLTVFLKCKPINVPLTILGAGTNVLVRDGGIDGIVIRLGKPFSDIKVEGQKIVAGAAAMDVSVARVAAQAELTGLEFLSGIPGTIGGAIRMNAGAYGSDLSEIIISVEALDPSGTNHSLSSSDLGLGYRHCEIMSDWIFVSATLHGQPASRQSIEEKMDAIKKKRAQTQPDGLKTGGSTFANPIGVRAWELIDRAGCRGLQCGDAMVSEVHCNFLVNKGAASSADLESLGEELRRRVADVTGVELAWEIHRLGQHVKEGNDSKFLWESRP